MNKTILASFVVLSLLAAGCSKTNSTDNNYNTSATSTQSDSSSTSVSKESVNSSTSSANGNSSSTTASGYTMTDVAKHSSSGDCWAAVNGGVYNLTGWISQHPGGSQAIIGMCGKDASAMFNKQHGGQREANQALASLKIGTLN